MYKRARYYDGTTGEFTSQDPLEYVDGMSLYRGYFGLNSIDLSGSLSVRPNDFWDEVGRAVQDIMNETAPCGPRVRNSNRARMFSLAEKQRSILVKLLKAACTKCPDSHIGMTSEECDSNPCLKEQCEKDAEDIANAVYFVIRGRELRINWRNPIDLRYQWGRGLYRDQRKWGYYCSQWAWGFHNAIKEINSTCFTSKPNGVFAYDQNILGNPGDEHLWVEITSSCSGSIVAYVDDSFGSGTEDRFGNPLCVPGDWVHSNCPDLGWGFPGGFDEFPFNSGEGEQGEPVPSGR